jgi:hypothetical protein
MITRGIQIRLFTFWEKGISKPILLGIFLFCWTELWTKAISGAWKISSWLTHLLGPPTRPTQVSAPATCGSSMPMETSRSTTHQRWGPSDLVLLLAGDFQNLTPNSLHLLIATVVGSTVEKPSENRSISRCRWYPGGGCSLVNKAHSYYLRINIYHIRRKFRSQTSDNMDRWKAE